MYQSKFTENKNHPIIPFGTIQVDRALGVLTNRTMKPTLCMEIKCFHWPQDILSGISVLTPSSHMTVPVDILLICLWYCHLFCRANGVLSCWAFLGLFVYIGSGTRSQGLSVHSKPTFRTQAKLQPPSDTESLLCVLILTFLTRLLDFLSLMSFKYKMFCNYFHSEYAVCWGITQGLAYVFFSPQVAICS